MKKSSIPLEQPYIKKAVKYFNKAFSTIDADRMEFWLNNIKPHLISKYPNAFTKDEVEDPSFFWTFYESMEQLSNIFSRVQHLTGVEIEDNVVRSPFLFSDIRRLRVVNLL